jgi:hypothetical protein
LLAPPESWRRGVRILVRMPQAESVGRLPRSAGRRSYPAQARVRGESLSVRLNATLSPPGNGQLRGVVRSYLERPEARPDVLQDAPIESWLDRWSIWMSPSDSDVNPFTIAHVLTEELGRRHGVDEKEVYVVAHHKDGKLHDLHAVIEAPFGRDLTRKEMASIGRVMVRELARERNLERVFERSRKEPVGDGASSRSDMPATAAQKAVLRGHGSTDVEVTRAEANMAIEELIGARSWTRER